MGADRREPLGATRDGPIQTRQLRRQRRGASPQKPRMHAGEVGPRRIPNRPRGRAGRTHAPPLGPASSPSACASISASLPRDPRSALGPPRGWPPTTGRERPH